MTPSDALHLASALAIGRDPLVVLTHDATMDAVARDLGLRTFDPLA